MQMQIKTPYLRQLRNDGTATAQTSLRVNLSGEGVIVDKSEERIGES
jgi:hypothetical protein